MHASTILFRSLVVGLLATVVLFQVEHEHRHIRESHERAHHHHCNAAPASDDSPRFRSSPVLAAPRSHLEETAVVDITRDELHRLANTPLTQASARLVPSVRDGQPAGLKVYAVRPGGLFKTLGVRNGDTLVAIDDVPAESSDALRALHAGEVDDLDRLDVAVERHGAPLRIVVLVHDD